MTALSSAASAPHPPKPDTRAIRAALVAKLDAPLADGSGRTGAQALADRLFALALAGDGAAIREILDRVDGRPAVAVVELTGQEPRHVVFSWRDYPSASKPEEG